MIEMLKSQPTEEPHRLITYPDLETRRKKSIITKGLLDDLAWLKKQNPIFADVSVHDLYPLKTTDIVNQTPTGYDIITQPVKVAQENNMIKNETNISASIGNKINKVWVDMKNILHKDAPTAITITKPSGQTNRTLWDINETAGTLGIITVIILLYFRSRGK